MSERQLTVVEAFEAMFKFLYRYGKLTNSEDVQDLVLRLSHMPTHDGNPPTTASPGYWEDWIEAVDEVVSPDAGV